MRTWNQALISVFNSIQEAREVPWAPRSKWGTPSRSRLDQGFSAWHSLDLTSGVTTKFEPWFRINSFHQCIRIHLIPLRYHVMIIPCKDNYNQTLISKLNVPTLDIEIKHSWYRYSTRKFWSLASSTREIPQKSFWNRQIKKSVFYGIKPFLRLKFYRYFE